MGRGDKVTDNPISWNRSVPEVGGYGVFEDTKFAKSLKNKKNIISRKLEFQIDEMLDQSTDIFLSFDKHEFIPLEGDFKKIFETINNSTEDYIIINSSEDNSIKCLVDFERFSNQYKRILLASDKNETEYGMPNIYLIHGLIEYDDEFFPLLFIPVSILHLGDEYRIYRNFNLNYEVNPFIDDIRNDITLPKYDSDISKFVNELKEISGFKVTGEFFLGNVDFKSIYCIRDIKKDSWKNPIDKFNLIFDKDNTPTYTKSQIVSLNNQIAANWDLLNLKCKKESIKAEYLIKNFLTKGKSILYVSNKNFRNLLKNSLNEFHLSGLILDINEVSPYNFNKIVPNNLNDYIKDSKDLNDLKNKLIELDDLIDITDNRYSALNMAPFRIKLNKDFYYNKLDQQYDYPIENAHTLTEDYINALKNQIIENVSQIKSVNIFDKDFFKNNTFNKLLEISKSVEKVFNTFLTIYHDLNDTYGITISNINSINYLNNFDVFENRYQYIDGEDKFLLNEYIKYKFKSNSQDSLISKDIKGIESKLHNYNDYIEEIRLTQNNFGINEENLNELFDHFELLNQNPALISDFELFNKCVTILKEYINKKFFKGSSNEYLDKYMSNNPIISQVVNICEGADINLDYNNLIGKINELTKLLNDSGINIDKLSGYFEIKDKLPSFEDCSIIEDDNYYDFNNKLKKFLNDNEKETLKTYIKLYRRILNKTIRVITEFLDTNFPDNLENQTNNLEQIKKLLKELDIKFNSFNQLINNKDVISILMNKSDYIECFNSNQLVEDLDNILNNQKITTNLSKAYDLKINDFNNQFDSFNLEIDSYLKDNFNFDYIKSILDNLILDCNKKGINNSTIKDLKNIQENIDILTKKEYLLDNSKLNEYSVILDLQEEFKTENIAVLKADFENDFQKLRNELNYELTEIIDSEEDYKYIKSKLNQVKELIMKISKMVNSKQVINLSEIDQFISNINLLNKNPRYIENFDKVEGLIDCIINLKNKPNFNENKLNKLSYNLSEMENNEFSEKIIIFSNVLDGCIDENLSVKDIKNKFVDLKTALDELNININISEEYMDSYLNNLDDESNIYSYYSLKDKKSSEKRNNDITGQYNSLIEELENISLYSNKIGLKNVPNNIFSIPSSRNINLNSNNYNYDKFINFKNDDHIDEFLNNVDINNNQIVIEIKNLKKYNAEFNNLVHELKLTIEENLKNILQYNKNYELYNSEIKLNFYKYYPNSFKGLNSDIEQLKLELNQNKQYSKLISEGFFNDSVHNNLNNTELKKLLIDLTDYKEELLSILSDYPIIDEKTTFDDAESLLTDILDEIEIAKNKGLEESVFLDNISKQIPKQLIDEFRDVNSKLNKINNVDPNLIKEFNDDSSINKLKQNIELNDQFQELINHNVFNQDIIEYMENSSLDTLNSDIYDIKIKINTILKFFKQNCQEYDENLLLKDLTTFIEDKINKKYKLANDREELIYLSSIEDYTNLFDKLTEFIIKYGSKIDLNKFKLEFGIILEEIELLNRIFSYKEHGISGKEMFTYSKEDLNKLLEKLRKNLILNDLFKKGYLHKDLLNSEKIKNLITLIDEITPAVESELSIEDIINVNNEKITKFNEITKTLDDAKHIIENNDSLTFDDYNYIFNSLFDLCDEYQIKSDYNHEKILNDTEFFSQLNKLYDNIELGDTKTLNEYGREELIELSDFTQKTVEFNNLIYKNIFNKDKILKFYNSEFKSKLTDIKSLIDGIIDLLNDSEKDYMNLNLVDLISDAEKEKYMEFSKIKRYYVSNNPKRLLKSLILYKDNYDVQTQYDAELIDLNNELENVSRLVDLELELEKNTNLLINHFKTTDNFNLDELSIEQIDEKVNIDTEFTTKYNEGIFSTKTINQLNNNFTNLKYSSNELLNHIHDIYKINGEIDYNDIYKVNIQLLNEINEFNLNKSYEKLTSGITQIMDNQNNLELLININQINQFDEIINKYDLLKPNYLQIVENNIKYTELIDNAMYVDENLIKQNIDNVKHDTQILSNIGKYLLKQVNHLSNFYREYDNFNSKIEFYPEMSLEKLDKSIKLFMKDINELNEISNKFGEVNLKNKLVKRFVDLVITGEVDKDIIGDVFSYNIYNSILNKFLNEYPQVTEYNLDPDDYIEEYEELEDKLKENMIQDYLKEVYKKLQKNNDDERIFEQKEEWDSKSLTNNFVPIKEALNNYSDYILANKPVFMMGIEDVPIFLTESYENTFDYVIFEKNEDYNELELIPLLLRSNNKIIMLGE